VVLLLQCGDVKDIIVLKDKVSGQSRGCAFVSYVSMEEAEKAIAMLNRSVHLPGALQPMEVRSRQVERQQLWQLLYSPQVSGRYKHAICAATGG
jgi:RNA recognition motif-containing protein